MPNPVFPAKQRYQQQSNRHPSIPRPQNQLVAAWYPLLACIQPCMPQGQHLHRSQLVPNISSGAVSMLRKQLTPRALHPRYIPGAPYPTAASAPEARSQEAHSQPLHSSRCAQLPTFPAFQRSGPPAAQQRRRCRRCAHHCGCSQHNVDALGCGGRGQGQLRHMPVGSCFSLEGAGKGQERGGVSSG